MTLCDATQYVQYLSPTEGGRQHDKRLADDYALHLPAGVLVEMPHKKPPKRELTFSQQLYNQLLSPLRVVTEHAHSGIKRLRIVADTARLRGEWRRDTVMVVACGLHNLRVRTPLRAYATPAPAKFSNSSK